MKASIYARELPADKSGNSVGEQLRRCAEFAEKNGISVVGSYIDSAPADGGGLPQLRLLTEECAKGCFEAVIIADGRCLSENETDTEKYRNFLDDSGVKIMTARDKHTAEPSGLTKAGTARIVFRRLTSRLRYKFSDSFLPLVYLGAAGILAAFVIHGALVRGGRSDGVVLISPESSSVTETAETSAESVRTTTVASKTAVTSRKSVEAFARDSQTTSPPKTTSPKVTTVSTTVKTAPKTVTTAAVTVTTPVTTTEPPPVTEPPTETTTETTTPETTTAPVQQFPADINAISYEGLLQVPGIGEVTAAQIIDLRERRGRITDMRQLLDISGIGEAKLAAFSEYLYVAGGSSDTVTSAAASSAAQSDTSSEKSESVSENSSDHESSSDTDDSCEEIDKVRINTADAEELVSKLGITEEQALDIINVRELIGGFSTIEELLLVDSLTQSRIAGFADRIELDE